MIAPRELRPKGDTLGRLIERRDEDKLLAHALRKLERRSTRRKSQPQGVKVREVAERLATWRPG